MHMILDLDDGRKCDIADTMYEDVTLRKSPNRYRGCSPSVTPTAVGYAWG